MTILSAPTAKYVLSPELEYTQKPNSAVVVQSPYF